MKSPDPSQAARPEHAKNAERAQTPPISDAQLQEMALADERVKRFAFASKLAGLNGGGFALFAVIALLSGFFDPSSFVIGLVLAGLAFAELHGRALLSRFDRRAFVVLTFNQLALVVLVTVYALFRIRAGMSEPSPLAGLMQQNGDLSDVLGVDGMNGMNGGGLPAGLDDMDGLYQSAITIFYSVVIAVTAVFQGGCALYYWTRRKHLDDFLEHTPAWAIAWKRDRAR
jgi:hypothetical protein